MSLEQDQIEEILERLPVKSLLRFKLVSKRWKMTIESQYFKEKHMIRRQLQEPDFLLIDDQDDDDLLDNEELVMRTLVFGDDQNLQLEEDVALKISFDDVSKSCDGLICIYDFRRSILVVNPSTKWMRQVPQSRLQALVFERYDDESNLLGFGKDICTETYKLVWLYNLSEVDLEDATTCEVFDFNTNTWRLVESSPYRIVGDQSPIYLYGSLHWLIFETNNEIKILSFDCHTEVFQVISESPITQEDESRVIMCNLNNRLCVSEKKWPTQDIWTLNTSNTTWEKIYSLDLSSCLDGLLSDEMWPIACPLAVLKNKKVLLFDEYDDNPNLVIYDLETRSYSLCLDVEYVISVAPYFQSLISIS